MGPIRQGFLVVVVATLTVCLGAACGARTSNSTMSQAHARWAATAPDHYRMTWYEHAMVGTTRIVVEVRGGKVLKSRALQDDVKLMPVTDLTLEATFVQLSKAEKEAAKVEASYDPAWGYPKAVHVDVDDHAIDDEYEFGIESLQAL